MHNVENIFLKLREDTETDDRRCLTQKELSLVFEKEGNPVSQSSISKLEKSKNNPPTKSPSVLKAYSEHFNVTTDYLLGFRNTKIVDENIAMISRVTGLSNDAIEMLKKMSSYKEYSSIVPGLGSDIDTINTLLEYQYRIVKKAESKGFLPTWSIFHYIKQYLSSGTYERELQDRLRICDGTKWLDIENGDILQKDNEQYCIQNKEAINSKTGSGTNRKTVNIVNTQNDKERYVVEIDKVFSSYSKDNIFRELDKIKTYLESINKGSD